MSNLYLKKGQINEVAIKHLQKNKPVSSNRTDLVGLRRRRHAHLVARERPVRAQVVPLVPPVPSHRRRCPRPACVSLHHVQAAEPRPMQLARLRRLGGRRQGAAATPGGRTPSGREGHGSNQGPAADCQPVGSATGQGERQVSSFIST